MRTDYWFRSDDFPIQEREEELTNPDCFGKSLAEWLAVRLSTYGYETEVIPEDWGWCVMCSRSEYLLWVGCGSVRTDDILKSTVNSPPNAANIVWHVFCTIEIPFFKPLSLFRRAVGLLDTKEPKARLGAALGEIISANKGLRHCPEP